MYKLWCFHSVRYYAGRAMRNVSARDDLQNSLLYKEKLLKNTFEKLDYVCIYGYLLEKEEMWLEGTKMETVFLWT